MKRIAGLVYASLTLLAVAVAATAKGYVDSMGEFGFVVLVSAIGLTVAHFWSELLAHRVAGSQSLDSQWMRHEASGSAVMLLPAIVMVVIAWVVSAFAPLETAITIGMVGLLVLMFAYTWLGVRRRGEGNGLVWGLGTAAVGVVMIVFKVVA